MTPQQQAHALITYFEKTYEDKYHRKPKVNRVADKWGFLDILQDLDSKRVQQLIDFYFMTGGTHTIKNFMFNYDSLLEGLEEKEQDVAARRKLRQETKRRMEQSGNARSEGN